MFGGLNASNAREDPLLFQLGINQDAIALRRKQPIFRYNDSQKALTLSL